MLPLLWIMVLLHLRVVRFLHVITKWASQGLRLPPFQWWNTFSLDKVACIYFLPRVSATWLVENIQFTWIPPLRLSVYPRSAPRIKPNTSHNKYNDHALKTPTLEINSIVHENTFTNINMPTNWQIGPDAPSCLWLPLSTTSNSSSTCPIELHNKLDLGSCTCLQVWPKWSVSHSHQH
jgi:hypothetical protein